MGKVKKYISILMIVTILLGLSFNFTPKNMKYALAKENDLKVNIETEQTLINQNLISRGLLGVSESEILYSHNNEPQYILSYTQNGYLITDRYSGAVLENGERNPYVNYIGAKKYFGGVTLYFIENEDGIFDITRDEYVDQIPCYDYMLDVSGGEGFANDQSIKNRANAYVTRTVVIPNAYEYIQRRAFGYNGGDYANTCTAIATAIVLNYLNLQYNDSIVPLFYESELLHTPFDHSTHYPQADDFHTYLVDDCSLGVAHFSFAVTNAINRYKEDYLSVKGTDLNAEWTVNINTPFGVDELNNDKPAMLTSTISFSGYPFHTMPIYGYRRYSDDSLEWLVHTGWYSSLYSYDKNYNYDESFENYMPRVWVPASTATFLYRFNYN